MGGNIGESGGSPGGEGEGGWAGSGGGDGGRKGGEGGLGAGGGRPIDVVPRDILSRAAFLREGPSSCLRLDEMIKPMHTNTTAAMHAKRATFCPSTPTVRVGAVSFFTGRSFLLEKAGSMSSHSI